MATKNKTTQTEASVDAYYAAIADPSRRADCMALAEMMQRATGEPTKMWGPSIVGFGTLHYKYASGREGDTCLLGFASRKDALVIYGLGSYVASNSAELGQLGKYTTGKGCLYIKRLEDVDAKVLAAMLKTSAALRGK